MSFSPSMFLNLRIFAAPASRCDDHILSLEDSWSAYPCLVQRNQEDQSSLHADAMEPAVFGTRSFSEIQVSDRFLPRTHMHPQPPSTLDAQLNVEPTERLYALAHRTYEAPQKDEAQHQQLRGRVPPRRTLLLLSGSRRPRAGVGSRPSTGGSPRVSCWPIPRGNRHRSLRARPTGVASHNRRLRAGGGCVAVDGHSGR